MLVSRPKIFFLATVEFAVNAFLLEHLRELSRKYDITVIVNCADELFLEKQGLNVNVIRLNISRDINLISDIGNLLRLIALFIKEKPLVVHSITPKAGLLGMLAAFISMVQVRIHTFTGQVWANKEGFQRLLLKLIDSIIARLSTINMIDSLGQQNFLIQEKVLTLKKSIVLGEGSVCGVNLEKFKPSKITRKSVRKELIIPESAFLFIFVGRLVKDKGVIDLVDAFLDLNEPNAYLLLVGPDESNLLGNLCSKLGPARDKLRYVDYSRNVERFLGASDVFCLPSYREGFGSSVIEAGAVGLPVIASDIYGLQDSVKNEVNGLTHPVGKVNKISACMRLMMQNEGLYSRLSRQSRINVKGKFDQKILISLWLRFYEDLIEENKSIRKNG